MRKVRQDTEATIGLIDNLFPPSADPNGRVINITRNALSKAGENKEAAVLGEFSGLVNSNPNQLTVTEIAATYCVPCIEGWVDFVELAGAYPDVRFALLVANPEVTGPDAIEGIRLAYGQEVVPTYLINCGRKLVHDPMVNMEQLRAYLEDLQSRQGDRCPSETDRLKVYSAVMEPYSKDLYNVRRVTVIRETDKDEVRAASTLNLLDYIQERTGIQHNFSGEVKSAAENFGLFMEGRRDMLGLIDGADNWAKAYADTSQTKYAKYAMLHEALQSYRSRLESSGKSRITATVNACGEYAAIPSGESRLVCGYDDLASLIAEKTDNKILVAIDERIAELGYHAFHGKDVPLSGLLKDTLHYTPFEIVPLSEGSYKIHIKAH